MNLGKEEMLRPEKYQAPQASRAAGHCGLRVPVVCIHCAPSVSGVEELESLVAPRQPEEELSWVCFWHHCQRNPGITAVSIMMLGWSRDVSLWL